MVIMKGLGYHGWRKKRKISVGLEHPKELEGDTIYAWLTKDEDLILLNVMSGEDFRFSPSLNKRTRNLSNLVKDVRSPTGYGVVPYEKILDKLAEENNAVVDYTPAILQGLEARDKLRYQEKAHEAACSSID